MTVTAALIKDVVADAAVDAIQEEMEGETFIAKSNDLIDAHVSEKSLSGARVNEVLAHLYSKDFVEKSILPVAGLAAGESLVIPEKGGDDARFDVACHVYRRCGTYLVHREDTAPAHCKEKGYARKLGFLVFLVEDGWSEKDGGNLQVFDGAKIVSTIVPTRSAMALFKADALWQISEIVTDEGHTPLAVLVGWYHVKASGSSSTSGSSSAAAAAATKKNSDDPFKVRPASGAAHHAKLEEWIAPRYLQEETQSKIRRRFGRESNVELRGFLTRTRFQSVKKGIEEASKQATLVEDRENRGVYQSSSLFGPVGASLADFESLLSSDSFRGFLGALTGLGIGQDALPVCEARSFGKGHYSILVKKPQQQQQQEEGSTTVLDVTLCCTSNEFDGEVMGGSLIYATAEEEEEEEKEGEKKEKRKSTGGAAAAAAGGDEEMADNEEDDEESDSELLCALPLPNTLVIVMRDAGASSYVKYVNHLATSPRLDVFVVYPLTEGGGEEQQQEEEEEEEEDVDSDWNDLEEEEEDGENGDDDDEDDLIAPLGAKSKKRRVN